MLWYNTVSACGGPCNCPPGDLNCACPNCGGMDYYESIPVFSVKNVIIWDLWTAIILCILLTLIFYFVYSHKKHKNPLKDAISKCWPRWITIFVLLISVPIITFILYKFDIL